MLGGEAQILFGNIVSLLPHVRAGRLVALAVTSPQRSRLVPEVPTLTEAGVPGVEVAAWYALVAPAATLKVTVEKLNAAVVSMIAAPDYQEQLVRQGFEPISSKPEAFPRFLQAETAKWAKAIKAAGIKAD